MVSLKPSEYFQIALLSLPLKSLTYFLGLYLENSPLLTFLVTDCDPNPKHVHLQVIARDGTAITLLLSSWNGKRGLHTSVQKRSSLSHCLLLDPASFPLPSRLPRSSTAGRLQQRGTLQALDTITPSYQREELKQKESSHHRRRVEKLKPSVCSTGEGWAEPKHIAESILKTRVALAPIMTLFFDTKNASNYTVTMHNNCTYSWSTSKRQLEKFVVRVTINMRTSDFSCDQCPL